MWVQEKQMNIGQLTEELYRKLHLQPPRQWFSAKIKHNMASRYDERDYIQQTGRTTYNCLTAIAHLTKGDDVLVPTFNTNTRKHISSFIERTMVDLDIPIIKSQRSSGYLQIQNNAQLFFASPSKSCDRGIAQQTGLGDDLQRRLVDVVLPDNALFDVINMQAPDSSPLSEEIFLNECEMTLNPEKRISLDEKIFITNDGIEFKNGDLINVGGNGAVIINLYASQFDMEILVNGKIKTWWRKDLNLMCKEE